METITLILFAGWITLILWGTMYFVGWIKSILWGPESEYNPERKA